MFKVDRLIHKSPVLSCFSVHTSVGLHVYYMYVNACNMSSTVLNYVPDFGLLVYINV